MRDDVGSLVGVFPNLTKEGSHSLALRIIDWLSERGYGSCVAPCVSALLGRPERALPVNAWPGAVRFAIVLGGDGTLLTASRTLGAKGIPLLGVNMGHFGFLTEVESKDVFGALPGFLDGVVYEDKRTALTASVIRDGVAIKEGLAVNDVCVFKGSSGRMTVMTLRVSGMVVDTYYADGVIVASPTGSTAYSLSAGGPLMSPSIRALLVTPVCAHTLYSRSIVLPATEVCEIQVLEPSQSTTLSLDGQEFMALERDDVIRVSVPDVRVTFLRRPGWSFYDVLRRKMKEGADRLPI